MIVLMSAALIGAVLTATLNWQGDVLSWALSIPLGGSFAVLAAGTLLFALRSYRAAEPKPSHAPPAGVVWC
jgi:hypothetical protein